MVNYTKLVRDKIPEILDKKGIVFTKRIATAKEYRIELIKKLDEEIKEFLQKKDIYELADIMEVIESLKKLPEFKRVNEIKKEKKKQRGGFKKRIILSGQK